MDSPAADRHHIGIITSPNEQLRRGFPSGAGLMPAYLSGQFRPARLTYQTGALSDARNNFNRSVSHHTGIRRSYTHTPARLRIHYRISRLLFQRLRRSRVFCSLTASSDAQLAMLWAGSHGRAMHHQISAARPEEVMPRTDCHRRLPVAVSPGITSSPSFTVSADRFKWTVSRSDTDRLFTDASESAVAQIPVPALTQIYPVPV